MPSFDGECPLPSPLLTMDEFESFEVKLQDEDYRQQSVIFMLLKLTLPIQAAFLCTLGGGRVLDFVKRIFEPLFGNRLSAEFNLTGTHNRRHFQRTRSYALLDGRLHIKLTVFL
ncbi:unnamed protein product [Dibothriocephalus latus]|uniref:Uncharacterized protein n=1 Tax=Dibothriocephalus latus TaxID=60516 RepID=A0A3P7LSL3_DIBLA|nr:unnamed protein product [Dibothriocephalus latus]